MSAPEYELPTQPSSPRASRDIANWELLVASSLARTQASAEAWRNGLAGFVTILTGVLILQGPDATSSMSTCWRIAVSVLFIIGAAGAIVALWFALSAASPALTTSKTLQDVVSEWGSVEAFEVGASREALTKLRWAKLTMAIALGALGLAYLAWWFAPAPDPVLTVVENGEQTCGTVKSSERGQIVIVKDGHEVAFDLDDLESAEPGVAC